MVASVLASSLRHLRAEVIQLEGEQVGVAVPRGDGAHAHTLNSVLRTTRRWLVQHELPGTRVHVDGRSFYLAAS